MKHIPEEKHREVKGITDGRNNYIINIFQHKIHYDYL